MEGLRWASLSLSVKKREQLERLRFEVLGVKVLHYTTVTLVHLFD
jgi:hypothetical protein